MVDRNAYKLSELINAVKAYMPADGAVTQQQAISARIRIGGSAHQLGEGFRQKSQAAKGYALDKIESAARAETDPLRRLLFQNILLRVDFKYAHFLKAVRLLAAAQLSPLEAFASWYSLYVLRFTRMQAFDQRQWLKSGYLLRTAYGDIAAAFQKDYGHLLKQPLPAPERNKKTLISITEFATNGHPLAQHALDLADLLRTQGQKEVMIINTAIPPRIPISYFGDHTTAELDDNLTTTQQISYRGHTFAFAQNTAPLLTSNAFHWYAQLLEAWSPSQVISFGPGNVLADCFAHALPTLAFPNTGEVPFSQARWLGTSKAPAAPEAQLVQRAGIALERVRTLPTAHRLPASAGPLERQAFGFPSNAKIALIVGMRLESECSPAFLSHLDEAAQQTPDLHFVFAGPLSHPRAFLATFPLLEKRATCLGMIEDVLSVTQGCDMFINPFRQGGGTSALYAMASGLPVITLSAGDVGQIWGPDYCAANEESFGDWLNSVLTDQALASEMRSHAAKRWAVKSDLKAMSEAIESVFSEAMAPARAA